MGGSYRCLYGGIEVFNEFENEREIAEARSGLARLALAQGDEKSAVEFVDIVLDFLEHGEGFYKVLREGYLTCVQVLQAASDPRAKKVLERSYAELREGAAKIKDEKLRRSFLENVPWNRELVKLWEEHQNN